MMRGDKVPEAIDALALHIRGVHLLLLASCFTLTALVVTAERRGQLLRAKRDVEAIQKAVRIRVYNPDPARAVVNLSAKQFLALLPADIVGSHRPHNTDCVSVELSDSTLHLLAPHLRRASQLDGFGLGVINQADQTVYLVDIPRGVHPMDGRPSVIGDWFLFWNGIRDPLPALRLLPRSLSWFSAGSLPTELQMRLSRPQPSKLDLVPLLDGKLPIQPVAIAKPDLFCPGLPFELLELKTIAPDAWRAIFAMQVSTAPGSSLLAGVAVLDTRLERSELKTDWQRQVGSEAGQSWRPGYATESFSDLHELIRGHDSMAIEQVKHLTDNLVRQAAAAQGRVSVAHLEFPAELAETWGLGILMVIQVYLLLQVLRLKGLLAASPRPLTAWIGLYPGALYRLATALSIFMPPLVFSAAVVASSFGDGSFQGLVEPVRLILFPLVSLSLGALTTVAVGTLGREGTPQASPRKDENHEAD